MKTLDLDIIYLPPTKWRYVSHPPSLLQIVSTLVAITAVSILFGVLG